MFLDSGVAVKTYEFAGELFLMKFKASSSDEGIEVNPVLAHGLTPIAKFSTDNSEEKVPLINIKAIVLITSVFFHLILILLRLPTPFDNFRRKLCQ